MAMQPQSDDADDADQKGIFYKKLFSESYI